MSISPVHSRANPYVQDETVRPRSGADVEARRESLMEKRLRETSEGLERLRAMPLRNSVQVAAEKVEMLRRRLEEIRMALMFMTPEQAKTYARELKQIAGALAAAARNAGADAGGASGTDTVANASSSAQALAAAVASSFAASADANKQPEVDATTAVVTPEASDDPSRAAHTAAVAAQPALDKALATGDDQDGRFSNAAATREISAKGDKEHLRDLLKEAGQALRTALDLLKSRLKEDKESQQASNDLAQAIQDLDEQSAQLGSSGLYDANGALAVISGLASSLRNINIQV